MDGDLELDGAFTLNGVIEATRLCIRLGDSHFSVSDAAKKSPKRELILFPFLRSMLSCEWNEYIGDGIRYSFSGNHLGSYQHQFRGEGDFRRVKEWSLVATYRKNEPLLVQIDGVTHPDIVNLRHGRYDSGPTTAFQVEFPIPDALLQEALGMNEVRFKYFLEWRNTKLSELP